MLGPPIAGFRLPFTARIESRTSSASNRRMLNRQNRSFSGSFASACALAREDIWYVLESMRRRWRGLRDQAAGPVWGVWEVWEVWEVDEPAGPAHPTLPTLPTLPILPLTKALASHSSSSGCVGRSPW